MRLDANDRSRLVFACLLTAVALPAIWWANKDEPDTGRPNVAAAGLPAANDASAPSGPIDTVELVDPAYLTPASTLAAAEQPQVRVGDAEHRVLANVTGSYRRAVPAGRCEVSGVEIDGLITVYNPANGQSVQCRVEAAGLAEPTVVLSPTDFDVLADFTDAPVALEIRD